MLHMKRKLMMAAAGVLAALMVFPAYGASRKPIKSISLTIKAEIKPDTDFGDELIEIETSSNKYSVDGYFTGSFHPDLSVLCYQRKEHVQLSFQELLFFQ